MASPPFGRLVRRYRHKLELSQEKVAERAGMSARHLSFLENGKAQPSREAALEIANALEVPTHELGMFLEAAGYVAPYTPESTSPRAAASRAQLDALLRVVSDPALLHDRYGTVTAMNARARALVALFVSPKLLEGAQGGHALFEHLRPKVSNWSELQGFFRRRVYMELLRASGADPELERLHRRWSGGGESMRAGAAAAVVRLALSWEEKEAEFRLLTATLGAPSDVALRDFRLILILPHNKLALSVLEQSRNPDWVAKLSTRTASRR